MFKKFMEIIKDEEGATMVEYALMLALIAVAVLVTNSVTNLSGRISGTFQNAADQMPE